MLTVRARSFWALWTVPISVSTNFLQPHGPAEPLVEIAEDAGEDQCFMFGHLADQVQQVRFNNSYNPIPLDQRSPELAEVFKYIESGVFGDAHIYESLTKTVYEHDYYLVSESG